MNFKKILAVVLSVMMILSSAAFAVSAEGTEVSTNDELITALAAAENVVIANDFDVDTKVTVPDGVVIDLNGKTLNWNVENSYFNNSTIKNGNIVLGKDDVHVCDGYFLVNEGKTLTLDGVKITSAEGGFKGYAVVHLKTGAALAVKNSTIDVADNEYAPGYIVYAGEATAKVDITNSVVKGVNTCGIVHATTAITGSTFNITSNGNNEHGINRSAVTITDSQVSISGGSGRGITAQHGPLVIKGNSTVDIYNMDEATIQSRNAEGIKIDSTAKVSVDEAISAEGVTLAVTGTVTVNENLATTVAATIGTTEYRTLQAAINAATAAKGDVEIVLASGTNDEDIIIHQTEGANITIKGNGTDTIFTGYIAVYGHCRYQEEETLVFDGVVFETDEKDHTFIEQTQQTGHSDSRAKCYPHNITVKNCKFTATGEGINTAVGMKYRYGYNIAVEDTTSTNMHSLMQNYAGVGLTIENVTITGKNGIAIGTSQNVTVSGADITATGYGLRVDAQIATKIEIADCDIEAFIPVVVRKAEKAVEIEFNGENEMTATNTDGIWCAIGTSEYEENGKLPTAPTGTITLDINDDGLTGTGVYGAVAAIGSEVYTTFAEALAVAENGDTISLLDSVEATEGIVIPAGKEIVIDLNGKDIIGGTAAVTNNGTLTIKDSKNIGKVYTTDVAAQGRAAVVNNGTLTIESGWFGDSNNDTTDRNAINRGNAIKNYDTATINGGYFTNVSNQYIDVNAYAYAINTMSGGTTTINNATVYGDINGLIFSDGKTIVNDGSFTLGRPNEENNLWYLAYGDVEIKGGTWTRAFAVPAWNTGDPKFNGNVAISGGSFNIDVPDKYIADGYTVVKTADSFRVVDENRVSGALSVKFRDITEDGEREAKVYEIVLEAETEDQKIHEFASADLTFDIDVAPYETTAKMYKVVKPAKGMTMTDAGDGRYAFNCDGVTKCEVTHNEVVLGTITISGFGKYSIATVDAPTNVVHATTLYDNLVESFVANGDTDDNYLTGKLIINTNQDDNDDLVGSIAETELKVPTQKLTVNIKFPNAVVGQDVEYQQMKVTVVGGKVDTFEDLGKFDAGKNYYSVDFEVPYNSTYTVEVTGKGYRTATYSVEIREENKTLNFWNNVMTQAEEIEAGNGNAVNWNFLAGDIVADNHINIYDLSAVVSYFGEINLSKDNKPEYAKYDLNRDGMIDSKDVAYVLVSWHN